jgi:hypothetical protein
MAQSRIRFSEDVFEQLHPAQQQQSICLLLDASSASASLNFLGDGAFPL